MSLVNKVFLVGNLGQDPDFKSFEDGKSRAKMSIATSEFSKNKEGERVQHTQWHNLVIWGSKAETINKYCKKGSKLFVEGKLTNRSYENEAGEKKYLHEIQVLQFEMLDKKAEAAVA